MKLIFIILFSIGILEITYAQKQTEAKKDVIEELNQNLDNDFKPAQSKSGIENQVTEIKEIIKQKRKEIEDWEDLIISLKNITNNKQPKTVSINQKWIEIERSMQSTQPDFGKLYQTIQEISQFFYPQYAGGYQLYNDDKKQPAVTRFINQISSKVAEIKTKYNLPYYLTTYYRGESYNYTKDDITKMLQYKNIYSDSVYKIFYDDYLKVITDNHQLAIENQSQVSVYIRQAYKKIEELNKVSEEKDININQKAISWGLPIFSLTVLALFVIAFFYRKLNVEAEGFLSKILLEIITVFLITLTVLILGLARILSENVLGTLLGGIAGYILNRRSSESSKDK